MALDGVFLRHIKKELEEIINFRVDKIYQINKDELILFFRGKSEVKKVLISSKGTNSARIHFTEYSVENPKIPPMLCMLFRKKLCGAKLISIHQPDLERVLFLNFLAKNELSETVKLTLVVEIMGKYSNTILIDEEMKVIDALKRVDMGMSSKRLILPGIKYNLPPKQDKLSILNSSACEIINMIKKTDIDLFISKWLLSNLQGISPVVCREIEYSIFNDLDVPISKLLSESLQKLENFLKDLSDMVKDIGGLPYVVYDKNKKPMEFSFMVISQYENLGFGKEFSTFSKLLDDFFYERDKIDRIKAKTLDLNKTLHTILDRISRKIAVQKVEIDKSLNYNQFKVCADLINSNLYCIKNGLDSIDLKNFYDENMATIKIRLNPYLTASQNAQKYYKEYRKSKTAISVLKSQIESSQKEFEYISSVLDSLTRVESEDEIEQIREELYSQGYLKIQKKDKNKKSKKINELRFISNDGFTILVGKNNMQNDELTLKKANKNDLWFHTKDIPGSHTIIVTNGEEPPKETLLQAAMIAAYNSKASESSNVPVDYTKIKNVRKPNGAKPGMVIYDNYKTLYVTPDIKLINKLID